MGMIYGYRNDLITNYGWAVPPGLELWFFRHGINPVAIFYHPSGIYFP